ncbi:hypothetical protein KI387_021803, partial [Taxus chinensis]
MDNVSKVDAEVELMDWEANWSAVEVIAVVGMEEVCVVEVVAVLVGGGVGEAVLVAEVDGLIVMSTSLGRYSMLHVLKGDGSAGM